MDCIYMKKMLLCFRDIMAENRDYLIEMDSVVGDGDLGLTMSDGFEAAFKAADASAETDCGKLLYAAGKAMSMAVPSTMGTLMASGLMNSGKILKGKETLDNTDIVELFWAYIDGVSNRGKAKIGEKTFLDGMVPAIEKLKESLISGDSLNIAAQKTAEAAEQGFLLTQNMIAVHGRAATRGEASRLLLDPGAAVAMLMMQAFAKSVE